MWRWYILIKHYIHSTRFLLFYSLLVMVGLSIPLFIQEIIVQHLIRASFGLTVEFSYPRAEIIATWTGKFGLGIRNEAEQRLIEFCQENALVIANTLFQHKRRLYTWTSPDSQYRNQIDYVLCSQRWRSSIQSAKTRLGADWFRSWTLIAKLRFKLKKVGKTTRPFRWPKSPILLKNQYF